MKIYAGHEDVHQISHLDAFFSIPPLDPQGEAKAKELLAGRFFQRKAIARILHDYNASIGNDGEALKNAERVANENAYFIVTGQQLGFMGGPAYTILKAITALRLSKQYNAIPLFWLATEDHDVAEIDHTYLLDSLGNLQKWHLALTKDGRPVEDLELTEKHYDTIRAFLSRCGYSELLKSLNCAASYSQCMAALLAYLFRGTGLLFIEPKVLRPLAIPFLKKEIESASHIQELLSGTTNRLLEEGGDAPLSFEGGTNLFYIQDGIRRKIRTDGDRFIIHGKTLFKDDLLSEIEQNPDQFSTNAAARTVLQNHLFPVLAYIAGPTEIGYFRQLKEYHKFHDAPMPWIRPRLMGTCITPAGASVLDACGLSPWDKIPLHWNDVMPGIERGKDHVQEEWNRVACHYFAEEAAPEILGRFVSQAASKLMRKIIKKRLKKRQIPSFGLHYLHNLISPHQKPQDRVLNWWGFQGLTEENLIQRLIDEPRMNLNRHQYIYL